MKKISMILFAVVLMVSFTACNGAKKTEEAVQTEVVDEATQVTTATEEAAAYVEPTPAESLKAFQAFAKEYGEAFNNLTKDPGKYTKLAAQVQQKVADMERVKVNLKPNEIKDYEKALKIITDVSAGGKK
ncbi:MAG: hypothetical protein LBO74_15505 [Candidatus Symbiothrix sp.]|jgi:uncharacterized protein YxeA|nr:hypothetical protein [Candidatus Symbiothrix sp.]